MVYIRHRMTAGSGRLEMKEMDGTLMCKCIIISEVLELTHK